MQGKKFKELLNRELSRKEFLQMVGVFILGVVGLPQLLSLLHKSTGVKQQQSKQIESSGYGSRAYGE